MHKIVNGIRVELSTEEAAVVQAEWDANNIDQAEYEASFGYKDKRKKAYPNIVEQLDMLYEAMESGEMQKATAWFNAVKAVKDMYPIPAT